MNNLTLSQAKQMMRLAYAHSLTSRLWIRGMPAGQRRAMTSLFIETNSKCASVSIDLNVDKELFFKFIDRANKRVKV